MASRSSTTLVCVVVLTVGASSSAEIPASAPERGPQELVFADGFELGTMELWSGTGGTVRSRVSHGLDDVEERVSDGDLFIDSSDLELVDDSGHRGLQVVGIRFQDLAIPQAAAITSATIAFETDEVDSVATSVTFFGEASDDAAPFADVPFAVSMRPSTSASVTWSPGPWLVVDEVHQTPDLSQIVEEIVGRAGWARGNSLVFIVTGYGQRTAEAYDGEPENAPLLEVTYTSSDP